MTRFSYRKLTHSFGYALRGLARLIATEQNARVHFVAALIVAVLALALHVPRLEMAVLFFAIVQVFAIEITNTAIEKLLDLLHPQSHDQIAFIKDALAGAVLLAAIIAAGVGIAVFYQYVRELFH